MQLYFCVNKLYGYFFGWFCTNVRFAKIKVSERKKKEIKRKREKKRNFAEKNCLKDKIVLTKIFVLVVDLIAFYLLFLYKQTSFWSYVQWWLWLFSKQTTGSSMCFVHLWYFVIQKKKCIRYIYICICFHCIFNINKQRACICFSIT